MTAFNALRFIEKKRDGGCHSAEEFRAFVTEVNNGGVPDYQIAPWLMAVYFKGLTDEEIAYFTQALADSGDKVQLPEALLAVDKHSTGGVGDKTTLIVAPIVAACGVPVAKLSGRGLGFTGGTVDKLESIAGMNVHLETEAFIRQVETIGCALSGHSLKLAPAEGKFYALRDVTGTVPSLPLIASSIVSKKIAGGARAFVFDVKCGSGAFMQSLPEARALARQLVSLSARLGRKAVCLISDMDQPLGEWVGNSVEVLEAVEVLSGKGPADTRDLSLALAAEMLSLAQGISQEEAMKRCKDILSNGEALQKFSEVIAAQGGNPALCFSPLEYLPAAQHTRAICAEKDGVLSKLDARSIGEAARALGGGRLRKEDAIDPSVGIRFLKKRGEAVQAGDLIAEVHFNQEGQYRSAEPYIIAAIEVSDSATPRPLILERVE